MDKELKYNLSEKAVIYGLSSLAGVVMCVVSMLLLAAICLYTDMSENYSSLLSGISLGISGFVAGYLASKKIKSGGILNGAVCGVFIYLIVIIVSLFVSEGGFTNNTLYHFIITAIAGMVGGIIGVNFSNRKRII